MAIIKKARVEKKNGLRINTQFKLACKKQQLGKWKVLGITHWAEIQDKEGRGPFI